MKILNGLLLATLLISPWAFAEAPISAKLTDKQESVRLIAKTVGNQYCEPDMCFGRTLQALVWQESSFGVSVVGDNKGTEYYYKHQGKDVAVPHEKTYLDNGVRYYDFQPHRNVYIKRVYSRTYFKPLDESSLGAFQIKLSTAKYTIEKMQLTEFYPLLEDEPLLISTLFMQHEKAAKIAVHYLIMQYRRGHKRGVNPWRYAVSKYNGGSNNLPYINKIAKKLPQLD